jgi:hypothetical protein
VGARTLEDVGVDGNAALLGDQHDGLITVKEGGSTGTIDEEEEERREGKNPAKITFWCFQMSALPLVRSKFRRTREIRPTIKINNQKQKSKGKLYEQEACISGGMS